MATKKTGLMSLPTDAPTLDGLYAAEDAYTKGKSKSALDALKAYQQRFAQAGLTYAPKGTAPAPGAPGAPNKVQPLIDQQLEVNRQNADIASDYNRLNEVNTLGSSSYSTGPDGRQTRTQTLSPFEQTLYDQNAFLSMEGNKAAGNLLPQATQAFQQPLDTSNLPSLTTDFNAQRKQFEDELFNSYKRDIDERFRQEEQRLQQSLVDRRIAPGSELYNREMQAFRDSQNRGYQDARELSMVNSGSEADRQFSRTLGTRQQLLGEAVDARNRPLNEYNALRATSRAPMTPEFSSITPINTPTPDVLGAGVSFEQLGLQKDLGQQELDFKKSQGDGIGGGGGGGGSGGGTSAPAFDPNRTVSIGKNLISPIQNPVQQQQPAKKTLTRSGSTGLMGLGRLAQS